MLLVTITYLPSNFENYINEYEHQYLDTECTAIFTTFLNELYCSGHVSLFCLHYVTNILTKESDEKKDKKKSTTCYTRHNYF